MLPILRTISVGGVFLAITILGLALIQPGRPHTQFASDDTTARGALIDRRMHPEWRQFLILSAIKRADEIERLRDLSGTPAEPAPSAPPQAIAGEEKIAGLPATRDETGPDDQTGSINVAPSATMPIDIGATSSAELPVGPAEETPPVITLPVVTIAPATIEKPASAAAPDAIEPALSKVAVHAMAEQQKPVVVIRKRNVRKITAKPAAPSAPAEVAAPPPFNFLQAFFASLSAKQTAAPEQPAKRTKLVRPRAKPKQTAAVR